MYHIMVITAAFLLDLALGDPSWLIHPVVLMGKAITALEKGLRRIFPHTEKGERTAGTVLAVILTAVVWILCQTALYLCARLNRVLYLAVDTLWCWQALALRGLWTECRKVYTCLTEQGLDSGRAAVSRIVGRDTAGLSHEGVIRACVETAAENFSDGVMAPLLYMSIGGAPLALAYKAVNTMDSMLGYQNEKYQNFGKTAARLDDIANWIPSRISAFLWMGAALLTGHDAKGAYKIWKRDHRKYLSPNAAQTESACAGSLGIRLGGPASYSGIVFDKAWLGDDTRPVQEEDILKADQMLGAASVLGLAVCLTVILIVTLFSASFMPGSF